MLNIIRHTLLTALTALTLALTTPLQAGASTATDSVRPAENTLAIRAARFFQYREWASAAALYTTLIDREPQNTSPYGHAIVASGMLADTLRQIELTRRAFRSHIPVDSLFSSVERTSFSVGQTSLYENYLLITKKHEPWLTRIVDSYLMRYYTYRRDPDGMITYGRIMLAGNPDSEPILYTLAQGYLLDGDTEKALKIYRHITQLNPQALEALLYLANHHYDMARTDRTQAPVALHYFEQAARIARTPYIDSAIRILNDTIGPQKR